MMLRIVECFTGGVGSEVVRMLDGHPHLVLVGVLVHSADKDGRDAGELVGDSPNSVRTTRDLDEILRLKPDCAIWMGKGWQPDMLCRLLRAGVNVYAPIGAWYLPGDAYFDQLESACLDGGATLVGGYPSATQLRDVLGFGAPIPDASAVGDGPVDQKWIRYIGQSARMVADALSIEFDRLELTGKDFVGAPRDTVLPNGLVLEKDTAAGVRWHFSAWSGDRVFYTLTKEQTALVDLGAGWRKTLDAPQWRFEIDGTPSLVCEVNSSAAGGFGAATAQLNAARGLNLVPRIVAAAPGCKSVLDFPAATGFGDTAVHTATSRPQL
jgi:hypothetical protein